VKKSKISGKHNDDGETGISNNRELSRLNKFLLIALSMQILITVPWYGISVQPSLLGKLKKFKKEH